MAWIGVAGAAIAGAVGGSVAAASLTAYMIGGIVIGAVVGAVYSGVTSGSILKGMLYGAIGGAAVGGAGYALYGGVAAAGAAGGAAAGAGSIGASVMSGTTGGAVVTTGAETFGSTMALAGTTGATEATASGGFLSTLGSSSIGSIATLGKEFLAGGMSGQDEVDKDWEREKMQFAAAEEEKNREAQIKMAGMRSGGSSGSSAALQYKAASEQLAFEKQKFREEFDESKRQFDVNRGDELGAKERFQKSVEQGGAYAAGQAQTVSLVEINRQRKELPAPPWISGKSVNKTSPATPQPQVG